MFMFLVWVLGWMLVFVIVSENMGGGDILWGKIIVVKWFLG